MKRDWTSRQIIIATHAMIVFAVLQSGELVRMQIRDGAPESTAETAFMAVCWVEALIIWVLVIRFALWIRKVGVSWADDQ